MIAIRKSYLDLFSARQEYRLVLGRLIVVALLASGTTCDVVAVVAGKATAEKNPNRMRKITMEMKGFVHDAT